MLLKLTADSANKKKWYIAISCLFFHLYGLFVLKGLYLFTLYGVIFALLHLQTTSSNLKFGTRQGGQK